MKRNFIIDGFEKEAPVSLKETPAKESLIYYNKELYIVADISYHLEENVIKIHLFHNGKTKH